MNSDSLRAGLLFPDLSPGPDRKWLGQSPRPSNAQLASEAVRQMFSHTLSGCVCDSAVSAETGSFRACLGVSQQDDWAVRGHLVWTISLLSLLMRLPYIICPLQLVPDMHFL